jgi:hypothetical protein
MTYNGWSNYATWRVYLDIFSDFDDENTFDLLDSEECEEIAIHSLSVQNNDVKESDLVTQYAKLFFEQVNFKEIAEHLNELIKDNQV